ncbi:putative ABC transport system substrate-binding protein [Moraxella cuniculi DSM 21768]|uniref:Putative ABC transport system substrate-binding protein n=1 Tax=Moraxella cuniculi DSM 21768 TaxID=1122245 RepID=A0A1N7DB44_9GAMM|nr:ABC transporter substrate-binding protein [Moraxella cuniculi]OOS07947.1 ABC transporter substrate-binding protein [Moraxella cuniculi]SIR72977.1 putative ABC transport system substrate-binding protein [Moraxella cuniculi DSM 21768]
MNLPRNKFAQVMPAMIAVALMGCNDSAKSTDTAEKSSNQAVKTQEKANKKVAISAIVEHPSLNDIRLGVIDGLASLGYKTGENLTINFQSAQGSMATAGQIAKQFVADNPDAIVAITTPTAQSLAAATSSIPLVYTAVSDPVAAKLIDENNQAKQANITGLSSQLPLEPQIELFSKVKPEAKRIGFVYSPGEANSVAIKNQLLELLPKYGMTLVDVPANRSSDVGDATRSLAGKVDLLYTSLDNGVASAMESMVQVANELKIPVITSDEFSVRRGATAALGVNDYDFGLATAKLVAQVLDGKKANEISPAVMNELTLFISPKHAAAQGVTVDLTKLQDSINVDTMPARQAQN